MKTTEIVICRNCHKEIRPYFFNRRKIVHVDTGDYDCHLGATPIEGD